LSFNEPPTPQGETPQGRRTTIDIYADILEVVKRHGGYGRVTRISYGVGMPVDRLKKYLNHLKKLGLIGCMQDDDSTTFILTPRGQEFLDTYWKMRGYLETLRNF